MRKEIDYGLGVSAVQQILRKALPLNRKVPGVEHLFRKDSSYTVHSNPDGSFKLEEKSSLPVFPTLPPSWMTYMEEETSDYSDFLQSVRSSLDILRRKVLESDLKLTTSNSLSDASAVPNADKRFKRLMGAGNPTLSAEREGMKLQEASNGGPESNAVESPLNLFEPLTTFFLSEEEAPTPEPFHLSSVDAYLKEEETRGEASLRETVAEDKLGLSEPLTTLSLLEEEAPTRESFHLSSVDAYLKEQKTTREGLAKETVAEEDKRLALPRKLLSVREKIADNKKAPSTEFMTLMRQLMAMNLIKAQENKSGLVIWFGPKEVHLFHRVHNRGFVMEPQDLKVADKALNNMGLTVDRFRAP